MALRVAIAGDGQMGLVLAALAHERGHEVCIWSPILEDGLALARSRHSDRLPGFVLSEAIRVETNPHAALLGSDMVMMAIPVQYLRSACSRLAEHVPSGAVIASAAKGIEVGSLSAPSRIIHEQLQGHAAGQTEVVVLSGPNIASEISRGLPALMVAACGRAKSAICLQSALASPRLRIYTSDDVIGVEFAGAAKNVVAIAAGLVDGLGLGVNAKSALLARGLAEIARLGVVLGAQPTTFYGLAGLGDLATTCFSPQGRNRCCGEALGRGESLAEYCARSRCIIEGVETCRALVDQAGRLGVEMPIAQAVHAVLFEGLPPRESLARLMSRTSASES